MWLVAFVAFPALVAFLPLTTQSLLSLVSLEVDTCNSHDIRKAIVFTQLVE
jgi:hypothetical protein